MTGSSTSFKPHRLALAAILGGAAAIALAPNLTRMAIVGGVGPTAVGFWRLALSIPALALWLALDRRRVRRDSAALGGGPIEAIIWGGIILAGLFYAADLGCWHLSIKFTKIANATLLANFAPVFVTLLGWALFRLRPTRLFTAGMAVALAGAAILVSGSLQLSREFVIGDALGLTTAVFYGCYILTISRLRQAGQSVPRIMLGAAIASAIALLGAALALGEIILPMSPGVWGALILLALVSHVGGQGLITWSLAHLPAAFSSVALLLQPVLAAMFAWAWFGEALGALHLTGGLIVLGGIAMARMGSLPRQ